MYNEDFANMEISMKFYTYIYRDPSRNNEPIYVGKGCKTRATEHLKRRDIHPFTQRLQLMKKEGVRPDIEIIDAIDEDHAFFMEECCIQVLGRKDLGKGTLLNLNDGGKGGQLGSKATRGSKGMTWWNNGTEQILALVCPEGYTKGGLPRGSAWNSGKKTGKPSWNSGKATGIKSKGTSGRFWWNDGTNQVMCEECPLGYERGMLKLRK